jgi:hypothetical protein
VKLILVIFLILTQLALQVGIPIHKHFCEMDGVFASVVLKIDHQCAQTHEHEKDCCSDELQVVKTNFDQAYSSFEIDFFPIYSWQKPGLDFSFFSSFEANQKYYIDQAYRPPPLYASGRDLQLKQQVWRI